MTPGMTLKQAQAEADLAAFMSEPPCGARVIEKKGWFWGILHYLVIIFTFGGNRRFKTDYITTIGRWIAVPSNWTAFSPENRLSVLFHEVEHIKQFRQFGFGNAIVGIIPFGILYLLFPFPFGIAYFRWWAERVAYLKGIQVRKAYGASQEEVEFLVGNAVLQLTGPGYGWTWAFKAQVIRWFSDRI